MPAYPDAVHPELVGSYPAVQFAGGGYVWDEVLEYRVWCSPADGAEDLADGDDYYYYAFASADDAIAAAHQMGGSSEPLALILQREYLDEPTPGHFVHVRTERTTEWPLEFLSRPRRTADTIPRFFAARSPDEGLAVIRGLDNPDG